MCNVVVSPARVTSLRCINMTIVPLCVHVTVTLDGMMISSEHINLMELDDSLKVTL